MPQWTETWGDLGQVTAQFPGCKMAGMLPDLLCKMLEVY